MSMLSHRSVIAVVTRDSARRYRLAGPALALALAGTHGTADAQTAYEAFYRFLGDAPAAEDSDWTEECQGVSHDQTHWYITQAHAVWRVPVSVDLSNLLVSTPGVQRRLISSYPELAGYDHFGDPVHHEHDGTGYLLVPVTGTAPKGLAMFRALDLEVIGVEPTPSHHADWVAVDPTDGLVYMPTVTSEGTDAVGWFDLEYEGPHVGGGLDMRALDSTGLLDEQGNPLNIGANQGGAFTPSGQLLYVSTGAHSNVDEHAHGIHVFDTQSWRRVAHSSNGSGLFNFEWIPGFPEYEEPEGLTIWDLDGGEAPGIRGQLHVILLDNDAPDDDDVYFKHFSGVVHVDSGFDGLEEGTVQAPFDTVGEASGFAWDGAQIAIAPGHYPETITLTKRVQLRSTGGVVTIGP